MQAVPFRALPSDILSLLTDIFLDVVDVVRLSLTSHQNYSLFHPKIKQITDWLNSKSVPDHIQFFLHKPSSLSFERYVVSQEAKTGGHYSTQTQGVLLLWACEDNIPSVVSWLWRPESDNSKAFITACALGRLDCLKIFHRKNFNLTTSQGNQNGLSVAAENGHFEAVKFLTQSAEFTAESASHGLWSACVRGNTEIVNHLLNEFHFQDDVLCEALTRAKSQSHKGIIEVLEKRGVRPDEEQAAEALHLAIISGQLEAVKQLSKDTGPFKPTYWTLRQIYSPLCVACKAGHQDIALFFLDLHPDQDLELDSDWGPLHEVIKRNLGRVFKVLLKREDVRKRLTEVAEDKFGRGNHHLKETIKFTIQEGKENEVLRMLNGFDSRLVPDKPCCIQ